MIRSFCFYFLGISAFVLSIIPYIIFAIISAISKDKGESFLMWFMERFSRFLVRMSGNTVEVVNLATDLPEHALYVANHQSYLDIPAIIAFITPNITFISKKEAVKMPLLGMWMKALKTILIDRSSIMDGKRAIIEGADLIKNGKSVVIFPEGTRSLDGKVRSFKKGSFRICLENNAPIIPLTLVGLNKIWPKKSYKISKQNAKIIINEPIYPERLTEDEKNEIHNIAKERIEKTYEMYRLEMEK